MSHMSSIPILAGRIAKKTAFCRPTKVQTLQWPYSSTIFHLAILLRLAILRQILQGLKSVSSQARVASQWNIATTKIHVRAEGFGRLAAHNGERLLTHCTRIRNTGLMPHGRVSDGVRSQHPYAGKVDVQKNAQEGYSMFGIPGKPYII